MLLVIRTKNSRMFEVLPHELNHIKAVLQILPQQEIQDQ
jgi:hypothetical protein